MKPKKLVTYCAWLGAGGAFAFFVTPNEPESRAHAHDRPEVEVSKGTSIHDALVSFSEHLEQGTASIDSVLDATNLLLATIDLTRPKPEVELKVPLVHEGKPFGYLFLPQAKADGTRSWTFDVSMPALARYGELADYTDVTIAYFGTQEAIQSVIACAQTSIHKRARTIPVIGETPFVTGGWLGIDANTCTWRPLTLTVEVPEDSGIPVWTSSTGAPVQGQGSLASADEEFVAAVLFSL